MQCRNRQPVQRDHRGIEDGYRIVHSGGVQGLNAYLLNAPYETIQQAYDAASNGSVTKTSYTNTEEDLVFGRPVDVILKGDMTVNFYTSVESPQSQAFPLQPVNCLSKISLSVLRSRQ
jgi:hypothetical protein